MVVLTVPHGDWAMFYADKLTAKMMALACLTEHGRMADITGSGTWPLRAFALMKPMLEHSRQVQ